MYDVIKNLMLCIFASTFFKELASVDGLTMLTASALGLAVMAGLTALAQLERWFIKRQGYVNFRR